MSYKMPDMAATNAEKDSVEYGLNYAKFIESEWLNKKEWKDSLGEIERIRNHMRGTVDVNEFKPMFTKSADASTLNLNWSYQSMMSSFVTSVTEGFAYDMYRVSVKGVDAYSSKQRTQFKREKMKDMLGLEAAKQLSQATGFDMMPKGYVPKSEEELNVYMALEYKLGSEIASELGIQSVFNINDWRERFNRIVEELTLVGKVAMRVEYDADQGLKLNVVPYERFIHSPNHDGSRDNKNSYYFAEVFTSTVSEVAKLGGGRLTVKQLNELAGTAQSGYRNDRTSQNFKTDELERTVQLVKFSYKTTRDRIFKKRVYHENVKMVRKPDDWAPPQDSRMSMVNSPYEAWYEGVYVAGTEILLQYGLMDNMMRDGRNQRKALPPFVFYELSSESLGHMIADISDDIYITKVKIRQLLVKMRPHGVAIDLDGIGELQLSDGTVLSELDQLRIFNEDGNLPYRGTNLQDETMGTGRPPIHDLPVSNGNELGELINLHNSFVQQLHDVTGVSPQAVGAAPPSRTSEGVYQGTLATAQRSVNNINNGMLNIQQRTGEVIISRLQSAAVHNDTKKLIENILGEHTTDMLADMANLHKYQFVLDVDVKPTDKERANLMQDLTLALQAGTITIGDKIDIQMVDNLKLGRQMIKIREKENLAQAEKMEQQRSQNKIAEINAAKQAEMEREQFKAQLEAQTKISEIQAKAQTTMFVEQSKMKQISLEKQWDFEIEKMKSGAKYNMDMSKEQAKSDRIDQQSSNQSKIEEQKQTESSAVDFKKPEIPNIQN